MSKILIFSGTTEGKALAVQLSGEGIPCTVCVATEYGELVMPELPNVEMHTGRMQPKEMEQFMISGGYAAVVDATHPFAVQVSFNIKEAAERARLLCLRLKRDTGDAGEENMYSEPAGKGAGKTAMCQKQDENHVPNYFFRDVSECAKALAEVSGNILLTTGSKELSVFCKEEGLKERLYVRVLPGRESIRLCEEAGIAGKHIIAMQGPFSEELNTALIRQFSIRCLVTKESGRAGGYEEKLSASQACGRYILSRIRRKMVLACHLLRFIIRSGSWSLRRYRWEKPAKQKRK